ncbi:hypothetical protein LINPERHAP1_LOCUS6426 [Linum perenne]
MITSSKISNHPSLAPSRCFTLWPAAYPPTNTQMELPLSTSIATTPALCSSMPSLTPSLWLMSWSLSMSLLLFCPFSHSIGSGVTTVSPIHFLPFRLQSLSTGSSSVARLATQWLTALRFGGS